MPIKIVTKQAEQLPFKFIITAKAIRAHSLAQAKLILHECLIARQLSSLLFSHFTHLSELQYRIHMLSHSNADKAITYMHSCTFEMYVKR